MTYREQLISEIDSLKPLALKSEYFQRKFREARRALKAEGLPLECPDCEGRGCVECDGPEHRSK